MRNRFSCPASFFIPVGRGSPASSRMARRMRSSVSPCSRRRIFSALRWISTCQVRLSAMPLIFRFQFGIDFIEGTGHGWVTFPFVVGRGGLTDRTYFVKCLADLLVIDGGDQDGHVFAAAFDDDISLARKNLVEHVAPSDARFAALDRFDRHGLLL